MAVSLRKVNKTQSLRLSLVESNPAWLSYEFAGLLNQDPEQVARLFMLDSLFATH